MQVCDLNDGWPKINIYKKILKNKFVQNIHIGLWEHVATGKQTTLHRPTSPGCTARWLLSLKNQHFIITLFALFYQTYLKMGSGRTLSRARPLLEWLQDYGISNCSLENLFLVLRKTMKAGFINEMSSIVSVVYDITYDTLLKILIGLLIGIWIRQTFIEDWTKERDNFNIHRKFLLW